MPKRTLRNRNLSRFGTTVAAVAMLSGNGCIFGRFTGSSSMNSAANRERTVAAGDFKESMAAKPGRIRIDELDQLTNGYADRYFMVVGSAVEFLKRGNPDATQRRLAHRIELSGVMAMNDIVSSNDPYSQMLDLVVSVTLQSMVWIDENQAEEVFGERAPRLIAALRTMRVEAWTLASRVLNQEQLERLDFFIIEWRRTHQDVDQVAFVKFDNFAALRSGSLLNDLKSGAGFLASVQEASQELKEYRRLAERAFWYSKRAPNLAGLQAEAAVNEILSTPEVGSLVQTADRLGKTAETLPKTVEEERKSLFADLDSRQGMVTNTLGEVRQVLGTTDSLGHTVSLVMTNLQQTLVTLTETLKTADSIAQRYMPDPSAHTDPSGRPGKPFDIQEYAAVVSRVNDIVTNLNQIVLNSDKIVRSDVWKQGLQEASDVADNRISRIFHQVYLTLGLVFILAVCYRAISLQLLRRAGPVQPNKR